MGRIIINLVKIGERYYGTAQLLSNLCHQGSPKVAGFTAHSSPMGVSVILSPKSMSCIDLHQINRTYNDDLGRSFQHTRGHKSTRFYDKRGCSGMKDLPKLGFYAYAHGASKTQ